MVGCHPIQTMKKLLLSILLGNDPLVGALVQVVDQRRKAYQSSTLLNKLVQAQSVAAKQLFEAKQAHGVAAALVVDHVQLKGV